MSKIAFSFAAASIAVLIAPAAQAAQTLTISGPSGTFMIDDVTCATGVSAPCTFTNTFTFTTPAGYNLASLDISSVATANPLTDINFSSVTFNNQPFVTLSTGISEFRNLLNQILVVGGTNTLVVSGTTGGNASYSGNIAFASAGVPEPATWGMLVLGFSSLGWALRRRRVPTRRIRFA